MSYPYVTENNLENRQYYMFSEYCGRSFFFDYFQTRDIVIDELDIDNIPKILQEAADKMSGLKNMLMIKIFELLHQGRMMDYFKKELEIKKIKTKKDEEKNGYINTNNVLLSLIEDLIKNDLQVNNDIYDRLSRLVKTFEVRKRIYPKYHENFKPADEDDYGNIDDYALLAVLCGLVYKKNKNLKFLNALLKLNDILISIQSEFKHSELKTLLFSSILLEKNAIKELITKKGLDKSLSWE